MNKKKHGCLGIGAAILVFVLVVVILAGAAGVFLIWVFFGGEEEVPYEALTEVTDLSASVESLSKGGAGLAGTYAGGEYGIWGVEQEDIGARDHFVQAEGAESVTWMVYMIGSDLESEGGCASADLEEMLASENGPGLNIVVQTGGASSWENPQIRADVRQRFLIQNGTMTLCENAGDASMCTRESLGDFISWAADAYPADRYMLLMWDHGGGSMAGFGTDEYYYEDTLTLADMAGAAADSGVTFDMVAFDACLMGTLEIGYAFEPYADYLLASEETVPGDGWYYTEVLAALSADPSMESVELGARFIDAYQKYYDMNFLTLSLLDLSEVKPLYEAYVAYYENAKNLLTKAPESFQTLSAARSRSRGYADGENEQIDLVDFVQRTAVAGGEELVRRVFSAVKYRNASVGNGSYGVAVYFPYSDPDSYELVMEDLRQVNCDGAEPFYNQFLSILTSGSGGTANGISGLTGFTAPENDYSIADWFEDGAWEGQDYDVIEDTGALTLDYNEDYDAYTLSLSDEEWDAIMDIQLQVYLDDGEGYIDLGSDQIYDWTDEGDLLVDFDGTWTAIDGNVVAVYALPTTENGEETIFTATVPAMLNEETRVDLYLQWISDGEETTPGEVLGYLPVTDGVKPLPKGYFELKAGDVVQPLCDYYTYDGEYDDSYYFGDSFTVTDQAALEVDTSCDLGESLTVCWIQLTDWYQQSWYTESLETTYGE